LAAIDDAGCPLAAVTVVRGYVLQTMSGEDSNTVARASLPFFGLLVVAVAIMPPGAELKAGLKKIGEQLMNEWVAKAGKDGEEVLAAYKK